MSTDSLPNVDGTITHKEKSKKYADYDHRWPTDSVPREPSFYQPAPAANDMFKSHFLKRMGDLPGDKSNRSRIVRQTIQYGGVHPAEGDNRYRFLWRDGESHALFSLIVELRGEAFATERAKHYAVTVYKVE